MSESILSRDEVLVSIKITDYGTGMLPDELKQIFKPFFTKISARNQNGIGLGLSISKQLALKLGGDISVKSQVNEGSTFVFTFIAEIAGFKEEMTVNPNAENNLSSIKAKQSTERSRDNGLIKTKKESEAKTDSSF